jgi:excisionase family DNA binding protein
MSLSDVRSELLRVEDAAQYLEADPVTVQKWCRDGALPCLRVGKS